MTVIDSKKDKTTEDIAQEWFLLINSGSASEQQYRALDQWLEQDIKHKQAFESIRALWMSLDLVEDIESFLPVEPEEAPRRGAANWLMGARAMTAAAFLIGCGVIISTGSLFDGFGNEETESLNATAGAVLQFATLTGKIQNIELEDGSLVKLDAESELTVTFSDKKRYVNLLKGRAFFDVAKDEARPFIVDTGENLVTVKGTAFDIRKSVNDVRVSVLEGVVDVSKAKDPSNEILVQLLPGKQMLAKIDGSLKEVRSFDKDKQTGWTKGHLSFSQARLEDIIIDANKYRDNKIVLSEQSIGDLLFTTSFDIEQSDQMLEGVVYVHGLEVANYEDVTILSRK
ncbi:FecR family protein [Hirschia litorea]|uniref:FecR family protein n=1 Tax=Hirschia litorea TaxID=1199156 RepID=A0ABW2IPG5_9PROT